jgi:hypothetical protein
VRFLATYREDESRIRHEHVCENFAWLNRAHALLVEATSRPRQHRDGTPLLRLERRLPVGNPYGSNALVAAGSEPTPVALLATQVNQMELPGATAVALKLDAME